MDHASWCTVLATWHASSCHVPLPPTPPPPHHKLTYLEGGGLADAVGPHQPQHLARPRHGHPAAQRDRGTHLKYATTRTM
jgi:hypothetical protein